MNTLRPGTVLLRKYRIDRPAASRPDARLYDATDVVHARHVCIEVFRTAARFAREVREAAVVDVGRTAGMPFVVLGEPAWTAPAPAREKSRALRIAVALALCCLAALAWAWFASR